MITVEPRDPTEYCKCDETLVSDKRVPMPKYHDCDYIRRRSALVNKAAEECYLPNGKFSDRKFTVEMESRAKSAKL